MRGFVGEFSVKMGFVEEFSIKNRQRGEWGEKGAG